MTSEELERLTKEITEEMGKLSDDPDKLTRQERQRKLVLKLQQETLGKIKIAKEKGNLYQEVRLGMDYSLLVEYGHRNPFLFMFAKAKTRWYGL